MSRATHFASKTRYAACGKSVHFSTNVTGIVTCRNCQETHAFKEAAAIAAKGKAELLEPVEPTCTISVIKTMSLVGLVLVVALWVGFELSTSTTHIAEAIRSLF
jgi:hypothetical protein